MIAEKRRRIEEQLWSIHEAAIGDYLETVEIDGKTIERSKRISELPREMQQNIEKITIDGKGRAVPQLYSKLAASQELRKILNIGPMDMEGRNDLARLSDAELLAQPSDTAKQLDVEINLNYAFLQQQKPDDERQGTAPSLATHRDHDVLGTFRNSLSDESQSVQETEHDSF